MIRSGGSSWIGTRGLKQPGFCYVRDRIPIQPATHIKEGRPFHQLDPKSIQSNQPCKELSLHHHARECESPLDTENAPYTIRLLPTVHHVVRRFCPSGKYHTAAMVWLMKRIPNSCFNWARTRRLRRTKSEQKD